MINDIILLKQGEVVLKGLNRRSFEQKLMSNIKRRLDAIGKFKAYCMQSTVYIEPVDETSDMDAAFEAMTKVFGLASVNRAAGCEKDPKKIAELAIEYLKDDMLAAKSFKAEAKRSDQELSDDEYRACAVWSAASLPRHIPTARSMCTTLSLPSISRCATLRPMSTQRPRPAQAACLSVQTASR